MISRLAILAILVLISGYVEAADKATVAKAVKADKMSADDCRKWYTVYKGAYIYVKELDAVGSKDFGDVFDRMRIVRDKAMPVKGNPEWVKATDLSAYQEAEFTQEKKTDFAEDLYQICEGLKAGIK